ncbi:prolyl oligopeptidase family serine peptidase [Shewanella benthica]|uniref:S9 family peptidase n=1 Tax=Shewanella benthica TaxID=43661 RepID=UPI00187A8004|nr:prolyl oligopeptidase family serine peptidase [Shewanella benthica]MBE7214255.1 S9 family peptidase [Shewanella benthica]MCL1062913.1 prolyl oligopeptidase family serine peptidase [Shewanella benthica]
MMTFIWKKEPAVRHHFYFMPLLSLLLLCLLTACGKPDPVETIDKRSGLKVAAYGSWLSPITAEDVYGLSDDFGELQSVNGALYFVQSDSSAQGKMGIKRLETGANLSDAVSSAFDVRSRVHEYGGSPFLGIGQSIFASKAEDQLLYRFAPNQSPVPLTIPGTRHADCVSYSKGSRLICVREDHRNSGEPTSSLVALNLNFAGEGEILIDGDDFYSSPRVSPDMNTLVWIAWQHPNMPWDNTELWIGELAPKGGVHNPKRLLSDKNGSITQASFSPSGQLYFVADFDNWWNLYRINSAGDLEQVLDKDAEFAVPDWKLGNHNYAFESDNTIIASYSDKGQASLIRIFLDTGITEAIAVDFGEISQVVKGEDGIYFVGAKVTPEKGIYKVTGRGVALIYSPELATVDPNYISRAVSVSLKSSDGVTIYGYFYGARNPDFIGLRGSRPPLLVMLHGGPTAKASLAFRRDIQYWTSRGFAVLDLNYRGSSGFGREYRQSLYGKWGIADVEDAVRAAGYLVNKGWVDGTKLAMRGSNAGGLTVLSALVFYDTFKAGVSYAGISDMEVLSRDAHKFESSYLELLVGKNSAENNVYRERSPLHHLDRLNEPLLLIQGGDDPVVLAKQSTEVFNQLKARGIPVAYLEFEGEGHSLRDPVNQMTAIEAELYFYGKVFGFTPAGDIPTLKIDNAHRLKKH